jgi:hypothetical protein
MAGRDPPPSMPMSSTESHYIAFSPTALQRHAPSVAAQALVAALHTM